MIPESMIAAIQAAGGRCYAVGGCVRDQLLELACKDLDVEVFGLSGSELVSILEPFGRVNEVGVSFGVIKLRTADGTEYDFTLPRRDNKTGQGHRGFQVEIDPTMSLREAALRRDFTLNAISRCLDSGQIQDPLGGRDDLQQGVLRACSEHFAEDPLRVLRGMQFAARFDFCMVPETVALSASLLGEYESLAVERVRGEWQKWALRGRVPSRGLQVLRDTGWLSRYPELQALIDVPQDPEWHPEGDVWVHTLHVCDAAAAIADRDGVEGEHREVLLFSALCHDLGKATTTEHVNGRWRAHGHCEEGVALSRSLLERLGCPQGIIEQVEPLVAEHLAYASGNISPRMVRRLARRLQPASVLQLIRLIEADHNGRPPLPHGLPPKAQRILDLAPAECVLEQGPQPLVMGRHLIQEGWKPDPQFREILEMCFQAQLDGVFTDVAGGVDFLRELLRQRRSNPG